MIVRLAFSVMIQADADVLLIDEVLAVGDASFQQKCADVFHEMRDARQDDRPRHPRHGRGRDLLRPRDADRRRRQPVIGDPEEVGREYLRLNFEPRGGPRGAAIIAGRLDDAGRCDRRSHARWSRPARGRDGEPATNVEQGDADPVPRRHRGARASSSNPVVLLPLLEPERHPRVRLPALLERGDEDGRRDAPAASGSSSRRTVANPLAPGRYFLSCWICPRRRARRGRASQAVGLARLRRLRRRPEPLGIVDVEADVEVATVEVGTGVRRAMPRPRRRSCSEVRGPARDRRRAAPLLRPALADRRRPTSGRRSSAPCSATRGRCCGRCCSSACCSSSSRRSSGSAPTIPNYPVFLLFNIVLFGFFQEATIIATTSVAAQEGIVRKTQFPRLVIPLVDRADRPVQPRHEPDRRRRLHPGLRRRADVDLAAASRRPAAADAPDHLRVATLLLGPLRPPPGRRRSSGAVASMALFYGSAVLFPITSSRADSSATSC